MEGEKSYSIVGDVDPHQLNHCIHLGCVSRSQIVPRMLVDTNKRDMSTTVFGKKIPAPIAFSPIGINKVRQCPVMGQVTSNKG
jgi:isopentenyl diphosphate isomerase/L-lactate dehydrogenase-like FMN-dependent dehydrogenase